MGGVGSPPSRAAPQEDLRWVRGGGAVERGVLLRPLGDVVVLMPPLTITSPELHRIVHTLAESHRAHGTMAQSGDHEVDG